MMSKTREEAVWKRVMAAAESHPLPTVPRPGLTAARLLELLQWEALDACTYKTLACRMNGQGRKCLLQLAREEQRHARQLETVIYLMTGSRPCPDRPKAPCVACTNEELRKRYQAEVDGAADLHKLADHAGSFAELFHTMAMDEERHAAMILHLLQMCL